TIPGNIDAIARFGQIDVQEIRPSRIIFDDQHQGTRRAWLDRSLPVPRRVLLHSWQGSRARCSANGQRKSKRTPAVWSALHPDGAPMQLDKLFGQCQTQTSPLGLPCQSLSYLLKLLEDALLIVR